MTLQKEVENDAFYLKDVIFPICFWNVVENTNFLVYYVSVVSCLKFRWYI